MPKPLTREFLTASKGKTSFQVPNTALQHALGALVKKDGNGTGNLGRTDAISRIMEVQESVSEQHRHKRRRHKA